MFDPESGQWHFRNELGRVERLYFGLPGDHPLLGDWDCDGVATIGVYRPSDGTVHIKNRNTYGVAEYRYWLGGLGSDGTMLAGDWDGDGCDTFAWYDRSRGRVTVFNRLGHESDIFSFYFGVTGDDPFAGDFDGDGVDTVGVRRNSKLYVTNQLVTGRAERELLRGSKGDLVVVGDWEGDGAEGFGFYRPQEGLFTLSTASGERQVRFGDLSWIPVSGIDDPRSPDSSTTASVPPTTTIPTNPPSTPTTSGSTTTSAASSTTTSVTIVPPPNTPAGLPTPTTTVPSAVTTTVPATTTTTPVPSTAVTPTPSTTTSTTATSTTTTTTVPPTTTTTTTVPPTTNTPPPVTSGSTLEVPLTPPPCQATISSAADWGDINNPDISVWCVEAGDYRSAGVIDIETSGVPSSPRWIRYVSSTHPAHRGDQAVVTGFAFDNADHWIVQGLTQRGGSDNTEIRAGSEHNVFDRMLIEGGTNTGQWELRHGAHNNTLQNSVLRASAVEADNDNVCVWLNASNSGRSAQILGTRIVNNEMYDCTDAIALSRPGDSSIPVDYSDTVIDHNDLYVTSARYSDGAGNLNPGGAYACAENAVDVKAGGTPGHPVVLSNNRMWGFRTTDDGCGGTGSHGDAVTVHQGARYVLLRGNSIWDVAKGISLSDDTGTGHVSVIDNVIWDVHNPVLDQDVALRLEAEKAEAYRNIVIDADDWTIVGGADGDYRCNVLIDSGDARGSLGSNSTADYNFYYNSGRLEGPNDIVGSAPGHTDLRIETRRWTGPQTVVIPNAVVTDSAPHAGQCDPSLGSRPGIGVDDRRW